MNDQVVLFLELKNFLVNQIQAKSITRQSVETELETYQNLFEIQVLKKKSIYQDRQVIWDLFHDLKEKLALKEQELVEIKENLRVQQQENQILEKELKSNIIQLNKIQVSVQDQQIDKLKILEELRDTHRIYEQEIKLKNQRQQELAKSKDEMIDEITDKYLRKLIDLELIFERFQKEKVTQELRLDDISYQRHQLDLKISELEDEIQHLQKRNHDLIQERDKLHQKNLLRIK